MVLADGWLVTHGSLISTPQETVLPTSETHGRMGTNFGRGDFWDCLGASALVMFGRWYPSQSLTNHK